MELRICKDTSDWVEAADTWCRREISSPQVWAVFVPAGETPRPLYERWRRDKPTYLASVQLLQIDEILSPRPGQESSAGSFAQFFRSELAPWRQQLIEISGASAETKFVEPTFLRRSVAILGLGTNGHVAFHEPGLPESFNVGCVSLAPSTCQRLKLHSPAWGVTFGLRTFLQTSAILLLVRGESKREVLARVLSRKEAAHDFPAAGLLQHPKLTIICDQRAYGE